MKAIKICGQRKKDKSTQYRNTYYRSDFIHFIVINIAYIQDILMCRISNTNK